MEELETIKFKIKSMIEVIESADETLTVDFGCVKRLLNWILTGDKNHASTIKP